ncbi:MAG: hypothetical protein AB7V48_02110 [Sedimentibacter sp.]
MALSYEEKINILNSYPKLIKKTISYDRTNYYLDYTKNRRKTVVGELRKSGNGYIYVGYLEKYKNIADSRGFLNINKHASTEDEFRKLIEEVIISFE